ncbi:hypothetical protein MPSEU_000863900 [Mayamaea pseudoterrestris]|nr:hypothetical protein MPSEU_000863900 [Mayamaea pseudoterrestris]
MIFELPFMPELGNIDSKSSMFDTRPYSTNAQSRQANCVLLLPARSSLEVADNAASRSTSIPLPTSHVQRTQSELQLDQDEEVADQRDATMFYRLVNGIRERHYGTHDEQLDHSERSLRSIMQARLSSEQEQARSMGGSHHFQFHQQQRMGMGVAVNHISPIAESMPRNADEWSITGFNDPPLAPMNFHISQQPAVDDLLETDSDIFDLDP